MSASDPLADLELATARVAAVSNAGLQKLTDEGATSDLFTSRVAKAIVTAAQAIALSSAPIDPKVVYDELANGVVKARFALTDDDLAAARGTLAGLGPLDVEQCSPEWVARLKKKALRRRTEKLLEATTKRVETATDAELEGIAVELGRRAQVLADESSQAKENPDPYLQFKKWTSLEHYGLASGFNFYDAPRSACGLGGLVPGEMTVATAPTNEGKCLGVGTPVLMHNGDIIPVEDVRVGDLLMGPDSQPRRVLSLARGRDQMHRIVPNRGDPWVCTSDHVLTMVETDTGKVFDRRLDQHLAASKTQRHIAKLFRVAVDFPALEEEPAHPYLMGLWLGDGTIAGTTPAITNGHKDIVDYCVAHAPQTGTECIVTYHPAKNTNTLRFRAHARGGSMQFRRNPFQAVVKRFLTKEAHKHIPLVYLRSSRATRQALLAGLLDTDGYLYTNGYMELAVKHTSLKEGVVFLARSLGFVANARLVTKTIKSIGFSGLYWRINLSGDFTTLPMLRHTNVPRDRRRDSLRTGFAVEHLGEGDYYGFMLDGDGRFLLGDFTVTHNSTWAVSVLANMFRMVGQATWWIDYDTQGVSWNKSLDALRLEQRAQAFHLDTREVMLKQRDFRAIYLSTEMVAGQLAAKIVQNLTGLTMAEIRNEGWTPDHRIVIRDWFTLLSKQLSIFDQQTVAADMVATIAALQPTWPDGTVGIVVIDHIHRINGLLKRYDSTSTKGNLNVYYRDVYEMLHKMARDYNVHVLAFDQMSDAKRGEFQSTNNVESLSMKESGDALNVVDNALVFGKSKSKLGASIGWIKKVRNLEDARTFETPFYLKVRPNASHMEEVSHADYMMMPDRVT